MIVNIDVVLKQRNKTRYWLARETKLNYQGLMKLCNNKTTGIRFDILEKICNALECGVEDILVMKQK